MAITKRWLAPDGDPNKGVDGWRLDVPGDIPHPFWIEWRKTVKQAKPDAYISGEIWTWAQPWLKGDQFDAVMNYRWADAAQEFFVNQQKAIKPSEFNEQLDRRSRTPIRSRSSLVQQNLFDSHDTDRFASMFVNPDLSYDATNRIQDNGPQLQARTSRRRSSTRGCCRRSRCRCDGRCADDLLRQRDRHVVAGRSEQPQPMVWEGMKFDDPEVKFDPEVFDVLPARDRDAAASCRSCGSGSSAASSVDDDRGVYAFARELGDDVAYVVVNRSDSERQITVPAEGLDGKKLVDWLDPEHGRADGMATARGRSSWRSRTPGSSP